jgi:serine/threonine protein kinase
MQLNIFLTDNFHVQLADFGLSRLLDPVTEESKTTDSVRNTIRWSAPELHNPDKFGFASFKHTRETDIYAYGGVFLEESVLSSIFTVETENSKQSLDLHSHCALCQISRLHYHTQNR